MGGTQSTANVIQQFENNVLNQSTVNMLNEQINETIVNVSIDSVKNCSSAIIANQNITISGVNAGGNFIFDSKQAQNVVSDFSCIQTNEVRNDIVTNLVNQLSTQLQNTVDSSLINDLTANVASKSEAEWGALPWASSDANSNLEQVVTNNISNVSEKNIQNILKTSAEANFNQSFYDKCVSRVVAKQDVKLKDITVGGNVEIDVDQEQLIRTFTDCVQGSNVGSKIIEDVAFIADFDIVDDTSSTTETTAEGDVSAQAKQTGLASVIDAILGPLTAFFGNIGVLPLISGGAVILCAIIAIIIVISIIKKKNSNENSSNSSDIDW